MWLVRCSSAVDDTSKGSIGSQDINHFCLPLAQMGALQSLLPLHSAVASARLTSCLGIDSKGSRSLSQGMLCSANPGV
ncbi:hypothetical protein AgCh_033515 [Apium graveolens]